MAEGNSATPVVEEGLPPGVTEDMIDSAPAEPVDTPVNAIPAPAVKAELTDKEEEAQLVAAMKAEKAGQVAETPKQEEDKPEAPKPAEVKPEEAKSYEEYRKWSDRKITEFNKKIAEMEAQNRLLLESFVQKKGDAPMTPSKFEQIVENFEKEWQTRGKDALKEFGEATMAEAEARVLAKLSPHLTQLNENKVLSTLESYKAKAVERYPDFDSYRPQMEALLADKEKFSVTGIDLNSPRGFIDLYNEVKEQTAPEERAKLEADLKAKAEQEAIKRKKLNIEGGRKTAEIPKKVDDLTEDELLAGAIAEERANRKHAQGF